jgi:hypothetical protein
LMEFPSITVRYHANIRDVTTGKDLNVFRGTNPVIRLGDVLQMNFVAPTDCDITWNGTGGFADTPCGDWNQGYTQGGGSICGVQNYSWDTGQINGVWALYLSFSVIPPSKSITIFPANSLSGCSPIGNSASLQNCVATSTGPDTITFKFGDNSGTGGNFYNIWRMAFSGYCDNSVYPGQRNPNFSTTEPVVASISAVTPNLGWPNFPVKNPGVYNSSVNIPEVDIPFNFYVVAPDLTAGSVSPTSAVVDVPTTFSVTISNIARDDILSGYYGTSTGASFVTLLQRSTNPLGRVGTVVDIGTTSLTTISANSTSIASFSYTPTAIGGPYFRVCADKVSSGDAGVIKESDETNNCGEWTFVSFSNPSISSSCSVSPTSGLIGDTFTWSAQNPTGGNGSYTYLWSGSVPLVGVVAQSTTTSYSSGGTKTGSVTITSGEDTQTFSCTNSVTVTNPINGVCSVSHYGCATGTSALNVENSTNYTWSCTGSNGGTTASCFETKAPSDTSCHPFTADIHGNVASSTFAYVGQLVTWHTPAAGNYMWSESGSGSPIVGTSNQDYKVRYSIIGNKSLYLKVGSGSWNVCTIDDGNGGSVDVLRVISNPDFKEF